MRAERQPAGETRLARYAFLAAEICCGERQSTLACLLRSTLRRASTTTTTPLATSLAVPSALLRSTTPTDHSPRRTFSQSSYRMVAQEKWKVAIVGESPPAAASAPSGTPPFTRIDQPLCVLSRQLTHVVLHRRFAGSGNWGSAIAHLVGKNVKERSDRFETEVHMWCFEEEVRRRSLSRACPGVCRLPRQD